MRLTKSINVHVQKPGMEIGLSVISPTHISITVEEILFIFWSEEAVLDFLGKMEEFKARLLEPELFANPCTLVPAHQTELEATAYPLPEREKLDPREPYATQEGADDDYPF